ncbi:MAG: flagellar motor switch protein FliM [Acidobacteriia bacterium]|nr:flagellar motor switch protein FliM [Terriglobia bacterium]
MEKILSQDEINALFSTMSSEGAALEDSTDKGSVVERNVSKYDFCRSDRIAKDQIRSIHQLHTNFARQYSSSLSAYLRTLAEVSLNSVNQISYLEFIKLVADPTLLCALSLHPLHGNLAMELSPPLVFPIIDMLLGGSGKPAAENRTLTEIETQVVEGIIKLALRDLKEAWRPILEVNPQLAATETKPQMLQLVAPGEAVVAIGFEIKVGENSGRLNLCIPSVILKSNRAIFDQQRRTRRPDSEGSETERISEILRSARITLASEIHDHALVVEDLLSMGVGDVIQLNHAVGDPIQLNVGGVPKFYGRLVMSRGKRAFEISHRYVS